MKLIRLIGFLLSSFAFLLCFVNAVGFIFFFEKTTENLLQGIGLALLAILFHLQMEGFWSDTST